MPYGNNVGFALGFQTAWGTQAAVGSLFHMPILSEDVGLEKEELASQNMTGRFDDPDAYPGRRQVQGGFETEVQPLAIGAILTAAINDPTSVTSGAGLATHTFTPRTTDFATKAWNRPVSIYKYLQLATSAQYFYDLVGRSLEIKLAEGGFLTAKLNLGGGKATTVASQVLTADNTGRWTWDTASISLGGAAVDDLRDFTLTYDEGVEPTWLLDGTTNPNRVKRTGFRTLRVSGTLMVEDVTELNQFVAGTTSRLLITLKDAIAIQSGYTNLLTFDLPQFKWLEFKPSAGGPGEVPVSFTGKAEYHTGSGNMFRATLINTYQTGYV